MQFTRLLMGIFRTLQTFSITFMSGLCAGHGKIGILSSAFQALHCLDTWQGALSSWKIHALFPKFLATTGNKWLSKVSIYLTEFILPLIGMIVPTPLYVIQPQNIAEIVHCFSLSDIYLLFLCIQGINVHLIDAKHTFSCLSLSQL